MFLPLRSHFGSLRCPAVVSSSRNPSRFRRRDHDGKDSRVRVVMKPGAVNTLDARQVQIRQLVINLWRPLRMFTTRKSLSMYATSLVPTSSRGTTTRFQMQPQLVPIFFVEQFPHLLRWNLSFRSMSIQLVPDWIFRRVIACFNQRCWAVDVPHMSSSST